MKETPVRKPQTGTPITNTIIAVLLVLGVLGVLIFTPTEAADLIEPVLITIAVVFTISVIGWFTRNPHKP
jgi:hypothetical protein